MITARSQYDERPVLGSDLSFKGDAGLTKQADAKDCDINAMFKRFERTGQLPDMIVRDGTYGDYSNVPDYQEAKNIVMHAEEQFAALDAHIRNRFDNDPSKFLAFCTDAKNEDEMFRLGLLNESALARRKAKAEAEAAKVNAEMLAQAQANEQAFIAKVKKAIQEG